MDQSNSYITVSRLKLENPTADRILQTLRHIQVMTISDGEHVYRILPDVPGEESFDLILGLIGFSTEV